MPKKSTRKPAKKSPSKKLIKSAPVPTATDHSDLVSMEEAVALLKTSRPTFYRWLRSGKIRGMKIGRQWRIERDEIERFLRGEAPRIDLPADISPLLKQLRKKVKEIGAKKLKGNDFNPVQEAVRLMILLGLSTRASDIHITSHLTKDMADPVSTFRLRIDGVLHEFAKIDNRLLPSIIEEWKRMANADVHDKSRPQDGRILVSLAELNNTKPDKNLDIRACFVPTGLGESVTLRILDPAILEMSLDRIEYAPVDKKKIMRALHDPWGLIVINGPTGSGKTTVLYACLMELAGPQIKTLSIEDPIEYYLPWVSQIAINESAGVTFPRAARAVLRSDPDVIMVGEIRDLETLRVCQESALTGHLVLTTLHANEAANALKRMVDMGSDPFVVAESTKLILSQLLVRKLCPDCSKPVKLKSDQLELAAEICSTGGVEWNSLGKKFRKAVGCDTCAHTGYRRRNVIAEILVVTSEIGKALRNDASVDELRAIAVGQGMTTLAADGIRKASMGETTIDEVMRVIGRGEI